MLELLALLHRSLHEPRGEVALEEPAHEIVLKGQEELGLSRVALPGAAPPQLAVDPA